MVPNQDGERRAHHFAARRFFSPVLTIDTIELANGACVADDLAILNPSPGDNPEGQWS